MQDSLKPHEETTPAMIYAGARLIYGQLVHPETVRPQLWLKHTMTPDYLNLLNAHIIFFGGSEPVRSEHSSIYMPVGRIQAFHLLPPAQVERDYDENEPNRELVEVAISCGLFKFEGLCRIATVADFSSSLTGFRESFRPMYSVTISNPTTPSLDPLQVPYVLIRTEEIIYLTDTPS